MWRPGPTRRNELCNACGIKWRRHHQRPDTLLPSAPSPAVTVSNSQTNVQVRANLTDSWWLQLAWLALHLSHLTAMTYVYTQLPTRLLLLLRQTTVRLSGQASLSALHTCSIPVAVKMASHLLIMSEMSQLCTIYAWLMRWPACLQNGEGFPKAVLTSQARARAELCGLQTCYKQSPAAATPPAPAGAEGAAGFANASGTRGQSSPAAASQARLAQEVSTELARQSACAPAQPLAVATAGGSAAVAAAAGRHAALPGSSRQAPPAHTAASRAGPVARTAAEAGSAAAGAGQADASAAEVGPAEAAAEVGLARGPAEAGHACRTAVPGASCAACRKVVPEGSSTGSLPGGQAGVSGSSAAVRISSGAVNQAADKSDIVGPVQDRTECHRRIPGLISGCDSSELMCWEAATGCPFSLRAAGCPPAALGSSKHMAAAVDAADAAPQKQAGAAELRLAPGANLPELAAVHAESGATQQQAGPAEVRCPCPAVAVQPAAVAAQMAAGSRTATAAKEASAAAPTADAAPQQQTGAAELRCPGPEVIVQPAAVAVQTAAGVHKQASAAAQAADAAPQQQAAPAQLTELRCPNSAVAVQSAAEAMQTAVGLHGQASAAAHALSPAPQLQTGLAEPCGDKPADAAKPLDAKVKASSKFGDRARAAAAWQALAQSNKGPGLPAAASTKKTGGAVPLQQGGSMQGELD